MYPLLENWTTCISITLADLIPGFDGPAGPDMLWIFLGYGTFIMLQKTSFGPKKINFRHRFKSAILAFFHFCENGTFQPVHEIKKKIWPKDFFWSIMIAPYPKNIHNMFQGRPKPGSAKVQTETFLKKDSQHFKNSWQFGFLWIPSKPGKQMGRCPFLWYS